MSIFMLRVDFILTVPLMAGVTVILIVKMLPKYVQQINEQAGS